MVLGLIFAVVLAKGSVLKAIAMIVLGLLLSMVGTDIETGASRMAFDIPELADGLGFATVAMGVFGFAEIIRNLDAGAEMHRDLVQQKITGLMPTRRDLIDVGAAVLRGTALGSILGILPGGGAVLASFAAYTLEKKLAQDPSRFGKGAIEGVAAPESANNAGAQTSFIPLLTLGIPPNAVMALMVGAMTIQGIEPGPQVMTETAGAVLGHDRLDVDRQSDADHPQPAADRHLGEAAARAVPAAVPLDRDVLLRSASTRSTTRRSTSSSPACSASSATG